MSQDNNQQPTTNNQVDDSTQEQQAENNPAPTVESPATANANFWENQIAVESRLIRQM
jgi:hypothetical protein